MLEGQHYQNAYVTRDVARGIEAFKSRAGVRKLITYEGSTPVRTQAGEGEQTNRLAFIWVGDLQYELIQPVSGQVDIYRDALPADDALAFHHICMRVDDWSALRRRVDRQSFPIVLEGGNDALRFLYIDTRPMLGHYVEYTWMIPERWSQMGGR